jgi:hypothetical protein
MDERPQAGVPVNIATNSIELGMQARVIMGGNGKPASIILQGPHGSEMKMPGEAFPFVKNGHQVLAIISVVQVSAAPTAAAPAIIRPGQ